MKKVFILFISILALNSCLKIEEASEIPSIKYTDYILYKIDTLNSTAYAIDIFAEFEDGDGNIGYPAGSKEDTTSLYMNIYSIKNKVNVDSTMEIGFRVPYTEPVKSVRVVKGEIKLSYNLISFKGYYKDNDSIKIEMYLYDREMNQSNTIKTPIIKLALTQ